MINRRKPHVLDIVWEYKFSLVAYTCVISFLTFTFLYMIGGVPDELKVLSSASTQTPSPLASAKPSVTTSRSPSVRASAAPVAERGEYPVRIAISKIGVDASVSNPSSQNVNVLNDALLKGAVRYPGSGLLGYGNTFIFGHSTGIRIVNNQAYKAFNRINTLALGDTIKVFSATKEYTYKVISVSLVESNEERIDFTSNKNMITLSTCNVFGQKEERFVVEAVFVSSSAIR